MSPSTTRCTDTPQHQGLELQQQTDVSAGLTASNDLLWHSSPVPTSLFMLSIGPTINANILLAGLLELPGRTFDEWREAMRHGAKVWPDPQLVSPGHTVLLSWLHSLIVIAAAVPSPTAITPYHKLGQ